MGSLPADDLGCRYPLLHAAHVVQSVNANYCTPLQRLIIFFSLLVFNVIDITCLTGAGWTDQSTVASGGAVCAHSELISWAFSFVTNATCTILIGYKAW
jgi:hypothetical protein